MARIITSQHYLDDDRVAAKRDAGDFAITVSPAFELDGEVYCVLLDGHHSLAAAIEAGAEPDVTEATEQTSDKVALLGSGDVVGFLDVCHMGEGDYIDAVTRQYVW